MKNLPPEAITQVAAYFQTLAEPTRLRILNLLREGERNVGELAQLCGYTAANVSRHLSVKAGVPACTTASLIHRSMHCVILSVTASLASTSARPNNSMRCLVKARLLSGRCLCNYGFVRPGTTQLAKGNCARQDNEKLWQLEGPWTTGANLSFL